MFLALSALKCSQKQSVTRKKMMCAIPKVHLVNKDLINCFTRKSHLLSHSVSLYSSQDGRLYLVFFSFYHGKHIFFKLSLYISSKSAFIVTLQCTVYLIAVKMGQTVDSIPGLVYFLGAKLLLYHPKTKL